MADEKILVPDDNTEVGDEEVIEKKPVAKPKKKVKPEVVATKDIPAPVVKERKVVKL